MVFRVLDGTSVLAKKSLAKSKDTELQSSLWAILPDSACSSLTRLAEARARRKTHLCVKNFSEASSSGSYGSVISVSKTSVRFHLGGVGSLGGSSPAIALTSAVSSGEVLTSVLTVFRASAIADLYPLIVDTVNFFSSLRWSRKSAITGIEALSGLVFLPLHQSAKYFHFD